MTYSVGRCRGGRWVGFCENWKYYRFFCGHLNSFWKRFPPNNYFSLFKLTIFFMFFISSEKNSENRFSFFSHTCCDAVESGTNRRRWRHEVLSFIITGSILCTGRSCKEKWSKTSGMLLLFTEGRQNLAKDHVFFSPRTSLAAHQVALIIPASGVKCQFQPIFPPLHILPQHSIKFSTLFRRRHFWL